MLIPLPAKPRPREVCRSNIAKPIRADATFLHHRHRRYLQADVKTAADDYVRRAAAFAVRWKPCKCAKSFFAWRGSLNENKLSRRLAKQYRTLMSDFREIGPTFTLLAPRVWEQIAGDVRARMQESTPLKRFIYNRGIAAGLRALRRGRKSYLAELLVFRALRDALPFRV